MGHKVHPLGFRLGITKNWLGRWYAEKNYRNLLLEDVRLRQQIRAKYPDADIARVEIERGANQIAATIHTARPGIVIGRGGQRIDELRHVLEQLTKKRVRLNIQEIHQPELEAILVAQNLASQIERRVAYRRAMKQAMLRTMQAGAKGIKIRCAGRLAGAEIARTETIHQGQVPLSTLRADIDYGLAEAHTTLGCVGVKVWVYRGDILPVSKREEALATPLRTRKETAPSGEAPKSTEAQPELGPVEAPPGSEPAEAQEESKDASTEAR